LKNLGLTFLLADFTNRKSGPRRFLKEGVVSTDRTMIVMFCDIKGSTAALEHLRQKIFRELQDDFFTACTATVMEVNKNRTEHDSRAVIDKYMGDSAMIYIDVGDTERSDDASKQANFAAKKSEGTEKAVKITRSITTKIVELDKKYAPSLSGFRLGARFGIAMGDRVILSVLGCRFESGVLSQVGDFTLTGSVVNLAARLEHATPAEFVECIAQSRREIESYTSLVWERDRLRTTKLGEALLSIDRQVTELYEICKMNFEIRADSHFVTQYESGKGEKMPWKVVPFSPRGFPGRQRALLLGGNSVADLLRRI
jgi:class 3 adenylate cyclase